jgi:BirA family biotin operon repressor/biotin-[acetyl-CoA-carboxylase] ligase
MEAPGMGEVEFSAEAIAQARRTVRLGHPVIVFERVGSTNDVAHRQALSGAPEGLLVVADEQTSGRGRMGRSWWAPKGQSLLFSILLRPALSSEDAGQLMMCLGLGTAEAIDVATGLHPTLKWPNDLLLDGRKLGGMLAELRTNGDRVEYAVLGLGLNVNVSSRSAEDHVGGEAWISLSVALGRPVDRVELLAAILARSEAWYERLAPAPDEAGVLRPWGVEEIQRAWAARLDTLGRRVTVSTPSGQLHGKAVGVSPQGALILQADDGTTVKIWGGDVSASGAARLAETATGTDLAL